MILCKEVADEFLKNAGPCGKPVDVDDILKEPEEDETNYRRRPWEEDAFFCGGLIPAYWIPMYPLMRPDEWTDKYPDK